MNNLSDSSFITSLSESEPQQIKFFQAKSNPLNLFNEKIIIEDNNIQKFRNHCHMETQHDLENTQINENEYFNNNNDYLVPEKENKISNIMVNIIDSNEIKNALRKKSPDKGFLAKNILISKSKFKNPDLSDLIKNQTISTKVFNTIESNDTSEFSKSNTINLENKIIKIRKLNGDDKYFECSSPIIMNKESSLKEKIKLKSFIFNNPEALNKIQISKDHPKMKIKFDNLEKRLSLKKYSKISLIEKSDNLQPSTNYNSYYTTLKKGLKNTNSLKKIKPKNLQFIKSSNSDLKLNFPSQEKYQHDNAKKEMLFAKINQIKEEGFAKIEKKISLKELQITNLGFKNEKVKERIKKVKLEDKILINEIKVNNIINKKINNYIKDDEKIEEEKNSLFEYINSSKIKIDLQNQIKFSNQQICDNLKVEVNDISKAKYLILKNFQDVAKEKESICKETKLIITKIDLIKKNIEILDKKTINFIQEVNSILKR